MMADAIDFSKMPCKYWSESTKISYLQRRVLVYSIMYYRLNESCISDDRYDAITKQLLRLQKTADLKEFKKSTYYYAMHDFEGSTGFDLYYRLRNDDKQHLTAIAISVLKQWKRRMENE